MFIWGWKKWGWGGGQKFPEKGDQQKKVLNFVCHFAPTKKVANFCFEDQEKKCNGVWGDQEKIYVRGSKFSTTDPPKFYEHSLSAECGSYAIGFTLESQSRRDYVICSFL